MVYDLDDINSESFYESDLEDIDSNTYYKSEFSRGHVFKRWKEKRAFNKATRINESRSGVMQKIDGMHDAKEINPPNKKNVKEWAKKPYKSDIKGVDTKKEKKD